MSEVFLALGLTDEVAFGLFTLAVDLPVDLPVCAVGLPEAVLPISSSTT